MNHERRLLASSRVALAALLHDLGKFAERAAIDVERQQLAIHLQLYCPRHEERNGRIWHSHKHAAYTALAFDVIERHAPELVGGDLFPFADWHSREVDDSLVNAAARHHLPDSFLQWVIATADRVASGFEREAFEAYNRAEEGTDTGKNHFQARQLTLFEQIRLDSAPGKVTPARLTYRYPLLPLTPTSIFPQPREQVEPDNDADAQQQYRALWDGFLLALERIPKSHRRALPLWLDHFDTLWQTYTHAIPSATAFGIKPEVSLYDHSKTTAALATALWRYHHDCGDDPEAASRAMRMRDDWEAPKLLLIQGDFFGIQAFIFAQGGDSNKKSAKLLRGRSFYVSLITECAALALLDALELPPTSQIINAAGKFLIVAPNTDAAVAAVRAVRQRFDDWFLAHSYGQSGIGIAWQSAACNDFVTARKTDRFRQLMTRLHRKLERSKFNHFDLCGENPPAAVFSGYLESFRGSVCAVDDKAPAAEGSDLSELAQDQIAIGDWLVKHQRLLISRAKLQEPRTLAIPLFDYWIHFTGAEADSGRFGTETANGNIRRLFDFSPPAADGDAPLWNGYARRNIAGYAPLFGELDEWSGERYQTLKTEALEFDPQPRSLKTLNHLACEDKRLDKAGRWRGIEALSTLKGDIDDLGAIFQQGLERPTFAKMAALSRQVDSFFSVYLPWLCQTEFRNSYTVFAGGDDFFLIGPWKRQIELARRLRGDFADYAAHNGSIHFSAGISTTKPGLPIDQLAALGEEALEQAKAHAPDGAPERRKNAVTCFGWSLKWDDFDTLWREALARLEAHGEAHTLSTGYVYGLLRLTDMAADPGKPENALWRSQLCYRTQRMVLNDRGLEPERRQRTLIELVTDLGKLGIERYGAAYKIALQAYLYQHRD